MGRRKTVLGLAAATPLILAGVAGARFTIDAAGACRRGTPRDADVPTPEPTWGLAAAFALDTLLTLPMGLLSSAGSAEHYERSSAELDEAVEFYARAGWLADPTRRHRAPTRVPEVAIAPPSSGGLEEMAFDSGWDPADGEPGADRWRSFAANGVVTVRLLRHPGGPRPWLVAVHGQGMGRASDLRMLRVRRLHEELGVNVALPVLPLHGPRSDRFAPDRMFVSNVYPVNNVLGLTQSVWDLRRLLLWLRADQGAPSIGVLGLSLGSYVCALLSTLEADLACVVALVPQADLAGSLRAVAPLVPARRHQHRALYDERATIVHQPVSPLSGPCVVPRERRFIVAGQADRIASPAGAAQLWRHWDEPSILWRPRGHLTTGRSSTYDDHLSSILVTSGLTAER
jgi:hypothetical protein